MPGSHAGSNTRLFCVTRHPQLPSLKLASSLPDVLNYRVGYEYKNYSPPVVSHHYGHLVHITHTHRTGCIVPTLSPIWNLISLGGLRVPRSKMNTVPLLSVTPRPCHRVAMPLTLGSTFSTLNALAWRWWQALSFACRLSHRDTLQACVSVTETMQCAVCQWILIANNCLPPLLLPPSPCFSSFFLH